MSWFNWVRLALAIPASIACVGLIAVLIADIKYKK